MIADALANSKKQEISKNSVPKREANAFDCEQYNPAKGEMALWTAVITQALMDAGSESRKPEAQHEKAKAIRWLLGNSEDFIIVCQNAGFEPQSIRQKAIAAIERGCVWRRGMAQKRQMSTTTVAPELQKKYYIPSRPANQPVRKAIDYRHRVQASPTTLPVFASQAITLNTRH